MLKVADYREHAEVCRKMASKTTNPAHKKQLLAMAKAWEMLATDRQRQIDKAATPLKN